MSFMDKLKAMFSGSSGSADDARGDDAPPPPAAPLGTSMPEARPVATSPPQAGRDDESA